MGIYIRRNGAGVHKEYVAAFLESLGANPEEYGLVYNSLISLCPHGKVEKVVTLAHQNIEFMLEVMDRGCDGLLVFFDLLVQAEDWGKVDLQTAWGEAVSKYNNLTSEDWMIQFHLK